MTGVKGNRIYCLDWLRGLTALMICLVHVPHRGPNWGDPTDGHFWLFLPLEFASFRTVLFVLLSGFGIHLLTLRQADLANRPWPGPMPRLNVSVQDFWARRFSRLYGPYVFALVGTLTFLAVIAWRNHAVWQHYLSTGRDWAADVLCHVFMVHNLSPDYALGLCNGPLWALAMEVQLYVLYFVFLAMRRAWSRRTACTIVALVSLVAWQALQVLGPNRVVIGPVTIGRWELWPFNFWWIWTLGALGAEAYLGLVRLPAWLGSWRWGLGLFCLGSLLQFPTWEYLSKGTLWGPWLASALPMPATVQALAALLLQMLYFAVAPLGVAALLFALVAAERRHAKEPGWVLRPLQKLGGFSYSLFLTHAPLIWLGEILLSRWVGHPIDLSPFWVGVRLLVYVPTCVTVAWIFHLMCERPFLVRKSGASRRSDVATRKIAPPPLAAPRAAA